MDIATRYYNQDLLADQVIEYRKGLFNYLKPRFLNYDFNKVKRCGNGIFAMEIAGWCNALSLFSDNDVDAKFEEVGVKDTVRKLFVPIVSAKQTLDEIAKKGIVVLKHSALHYIIEYVQNKIYVATLNAIIPAKSNAVETNEGYIGLLNLYRTGKYRSKPNAKQPNLFQSAMHQFLRDLETLNTTDYNIKTFMLNLAKGKNENYYIKQLIQCFYAPQLSRDELRRNIFPLLRLIVQDLPEKDKLLTQEEFEAKTEVDEEYYLAKGYPGYTARKVEIYERLSDFS